MAVSRSLFLTYMNSGDNDSTYEALRDPASKAATLLNFKGYYS